MSFYNVIPSLIMVLLVALFLFLLCETTISFVFYFTGFLLILTLINIWYISRPKSVQPTMPEEINNVRFYGGETMITKQNRNSIRDYTLDVLTTGSSIFSRPNTRLSTKRSSDNDE